MHVGLKNMVFFLFCRLHNCETPLALEDALELSASCKTQQCLVSYVLQISFTNIEDKMNLMPQINILKLDEILPNRSSTNTNPAAEGTFDFLSISNSIILKTHYRLTFHYKIHVK